jgi:hypothetical protein
LTIPQIVHTQQTKGIIVSVYSDLNDRLVSFNAPETCPPDDAPTIALLQSAGITIAEAVHMLLPVVGTRSKAVLAIVHLSNLAGIKPTPEDVQAILNELLLLQHQDSHGGDLLYQTHSPKHDAPKRNLHEVIGFIDDLKIKKHLKASVRGLLHATKAPE